jgi:hypothetical protein
MTTPPGRGPDGVVDAASGDRGRRLVAAGGVVWSDQAFWRDAARFAATRVVRLIRRIVSGSIGRFPVGVRVCSWFGRAVLMDECCGQPRPGLPSVPSARSASALGRWSRVRLVLMT